MARKTLSQLVTAISTFIDNINGEITEAMLRGFFTDLKDSLTHLDDFEIHTENVSNPHEVTKDQVGLGNCDNTADADKPISDAAQAAFDGKRNRASAPKTGSVISFDEDAVYGRYATPITAGAFTFLGSGSAQLQSEVIIIHQAGGEPTFSSEFNKLPTSGAYNNGQINYITCKYIDTNRIIYRIDRH